MTVEDLIRDNDLDGVKRWTLEGGKDISPICQQNIIKCAIEYENREIFEYLIKHYNFDINESVNPFRNSLLVDMLEIGHIISFDFILYLFDYVKDINALNGQPYTALHKAIDIYSKIMMDGDNSSEIYKNVIIELLKRGANPIINLNMSVMVVVADNMLDILKLFVQYSQIDITWEALMISIRLDNYDFVEYLVTQINDINKRGEEGLTLLHIAQGVLVPNPDIIELLLYNGAIHQPIR